MFTIHNITALVLGEDIDDLLTVVVCVERMLRGEGRWRGVTTVLLVKAQDRTVREKGPWKE